MHIFKIKDFHFFCCPYCSARTTVGLTLAELFHVCQSYANLCRSSIWTSLFGALLTPVPTHTHKSQPVLGATWFPRPHLCPASSVCSKSSYNHKGQNFRFVPRENLPIAAGHQPPSQKVCAFFSLKEKKRKNKTKENRSPAEIQSVPQALQLRWLWPRGICNFTMRKG